MEESNNNIPLLTDLIERGIEIKLSELGLDNNEHLALQNGLIESQPAQLKPGLEQAIRRILDAHLELAWQEIKLAIQQSAAEEPLDPEIKVSSEDHYWQQFSPLKPIQNCFYTLFFIRYSEWPAMPTLVSAATHR